MAARKSGDRKERHTSDLTTTASIYPYFISVKSLSRFIPIFPFDNHDLIITPPLKTIIPMRKWILLIAISLASSASLLQAQSTARIKDSIKVEQLLLKAEDAFKKNKLRELKSTAQKAQQLASKNGFRELYLSTERYLGLYYQKKGNYDEALSAFNGGLAEAKVFQLENLTGMLHDDISSVYGEIGDTTLYLKHLKLASKYHQRCTSHKANIASLKKVSKYYRKKQNYIPDSVAYYQKRMADLHLIVGDTIEAAKLYAYITYNKVRANCTLSEAQYYKDLTITYAENELCKTTDSNKIDTLNFIIAKAYQNYAVFYEQKWGELSTSQLEEYVYNLFNAKEYFDKCHDNYDRFGILIFLSNTMTYALGYHEDAILIDLEFFKLLDKTDEETKKKLEKYKIGSYERMALNYKELGRYIESIKAYQNAINLCSNFASCKEKSLYYYDLADIYINYFPIDSLEQGYKFASLAFKNNHEYSFINKSDCISLLTQKYLALGMMDSVKSVLSWHHKKDDLDVATKLELAHFLQPTRPDSSLLIFKELLHSDHQLKVVDKIDILHKIVGTYTDNDNKQDLVLYMQTLHEQAKANKDSLMIFYSAAEILRLNSQDTLYISIDSMRDYHEEVCTHSKILSARENIDFQLLCMYDDIIFRLVEPYVNSDSIPEEVMEQLKYETVKLLDRLEQANTLFAEELSIVLIDHAIRMQDCAGAFEFANIALQKPFIINDVHQRQRFEELYALTQFCVKPYDYKEYEAAQKTIIYTCEFSGDTCCIVSKNFDMAINAIGECRNEDGLEYMKLARQWAGDEWSECYGSLNYLNYVELLALFRLERFEEVSIKSKQLEPDIFENIFKIADDQMSYDILGAVGEALNKHEEFERAFKYDEATVEFFSKTEYHERTGSGYLSMSVNAEKMGLHDLAFQSALDAIIGLEKSGCHFHITEAYVQALQTAPKDISEKLMRLLVGRFKELYDNYQTQYGHEEHQPKGLIRGPELIAARLYDVLDRVEIGKQEIEQLNTSLEIANSSLERTLDEKELALNEKILAIIEKNRAISDLEDANTKITSSKQRADSLNVKLGRANEAKSETITKLKEEQARSKRLMQGLSFSLALTLIFLLTTLALMSGLKRRKAAIEEQNKIIANQKSEIYHRVKDNFENLKNIIKIQQERTENKVVNETLQNTNDVIENYQQIHELIYSGKEGFMTNLKSLFTKLSLLKQKAYLNSVGPVEMIRDIDDGIMLPAKKATPLGLAIQEMMTNSFRHAFPNSVANPRIELNLSENNGQYQLEYKDNGIGFSQSQSAAGNTLGLSIIDFQVKNALKGDIKVASEPNGGTQYTIKF